MIELRWLEKETGRQLRNDWGYFYYETIKVLQYRTSSVKMYTVHDGDQVREVVEPVYTEWTDVPTVTEPRGI